MRRKHGDKTGGENRPPAARMLATQFGDSLAHFDGLRPIGVVAEEILEVGGGGAALAAPQVNLGQEQLGMREVRRIELARPLEIFERQIEVTNLEIGLAELRVSQGIVAPSENGADIVIERVVKAVHGDQHATQVYQRLVRFRFLLKGLPRQFPQRVNWRR